MTVNQIASVQFAYRSFAAQNAAASKNINRLSSGYRINSAADDAAGLAVSEKIRSQIGGLVKAFENTQSATSLLQTAEGGMSTATSLLTRMRDLAVQASNGTYSDSDRALINEEFQTLKGELDRVSSSTQYNTMNLLDGSLGGRTGEAGVSRMGITDITAGAGNIDEGSAKLNITEDNGVYSITAYMNGEAVTNTLTAGDTSTTLTFDNGDTLTVDFSGGVSSLQTGVIANIGVEAGNVDTSAAVSAASGTELQFQIGANGSADQRMGVSIGDLSAFGLGVHDLDVLNANNANSALAAIDNAINAVNSQRSNIGATQNRLEHSANNLQTSSINMQKSESTIRDLNFAKAITNFMQQKVQMQASQAMMAQNMNLNRSFTLGLLLR